MTSKDKFNMDKSIQIFFIESRENLQELESSLLDIEKGESDEEFLNSIFRNIHTIKGSSGMFEFTEIEGFTHVVETLLDNVRNGEIQIDSELVSLLLESSDYIAELLNIYENSEDKQLDDKMIETRDTLLNKLNEYIPEETTKTEEMDTLSEDTAVDEIEDSEKVLNNCWHISLRPGKEIFCLGLDPQSFINYLANIGEIKCIAAVTESIPALSEMDAEKCYLGFEIDMLTSHSKETIEEVFEFVKEDCVVKILPPRSSINEYIRLIEELPEEKARIGEILVEIGTLTNNELDKAINTQMELSSKKTTEEKIKPIGEIILENKMVQEPVLEAALEKQVKMSKSSTIRIEAEKLDNLINLVGELVISGANIKQLSEFDIIDKSSLTKSTSVMSRLIEDIRESTMNIRMVQIGTTFKRFERVVRDLSRERGKEIDLFISGGDTELDKTLIEKISDPLMHLIRNAIDHGIDTPEERIKSGKPGKGTINLNAYHETGNIVIEIIDDGEGLNRDNIYNKAIESKLIQPDQQISDQELFQYIFEAGFSTAKEVTNISGRGVGMDVVKRNIESLRGSILLDSQEGEGTSVKIHLPLTLAIIDGFMIQVNDSYYVLPLDMVIECIEVNKEDIHAKEGGRIINLRGEALPFLVLRDFFKEEGEEPDIANIIVVEYMGSKAGLVVDNLVGEFQTVIKPLGIIFNEVDWISGSTVLGSGDIALIIDVPRLVKNIQEADIKEAVIEAV